MHGNRKTMLDPKTSFADSILTATDSGMETKNSVNALDELGLLMYPHEIVLPTNVARRNVQFTCIDMSTKYLAIGASTGTVYLYARGISSLPIEERDAASNSTIAPSACTPLASNSSSFRETESIETTSFRLLRLVAPPGSDRIAITQLAICPNQRYLAVGTKRGAVYAISLQEVRRSSGEKPEFAHEYHVGFPVTYFLWDATGSRLFSACNSGVIAVTTLRVGVSAYFGAANTDMLLREDSGIVQLDFTTWKGREMLLVSSQTRVLLLELNSTHAKAVQVGSKLRQGKFGACFHLNDGPPLEPAPALELKVFSSRPGKRMWVANPETGQVVSTLKFSDPGPSKNFLGMEAKIQENINMHSFSFAHICVFNFRRQARVKHPSPSLMVCFSPGQEGLFFVDPMQVEVVEWHVELGKIYDVKISSKESILVLHGPNRKISMIKACTAREFLELSITSDLKKSAEVALGYGIRDIGILERIQHGLATFLQAQAHVVEDHSMHDLLQQKDLLVKVEKVLFEAKQFYEDNEICLNQSVVNVSSSPRAFVAKEEKPFEVDVKMVTLQSKIQSKAEYDSAESHPTSIDSSHVLHPTGKGRPRVRYIDIKPLPENDPVVYEQRASTNDRNDDENTSTLHELRSTTESSSHPLSSMNMSSLFSLGGTTNYPSVAASALSTYFPKGSQLFNKILDMEDSHSISRGLEKNDLTPIRDLAYESMQLVLRTVMSNDVSGVYEVEAILEAISLNLWEANLKHSVKVAATPLLQAQAQLHSIATELVSETTLPSSHTANAIPAMELASQKNLFGTAHPSTAVLSMNQAQMEVHGTHPSKPYLKQTVPSRSPKSPKRSPPRTKVMHSTMHAPLQNPHRNERPSVTFASSTMKVEFQTLLMNAMVAHPSLFSLLARSFDELNAELTAAAHAALNQPVLAHRIWPASGITRTCVCLVNMSFLFGDLKSVHSLLKDWMSCFNPGSTEAENGPRVIDLAGWARGRALIGGDGLPLSRDDWCLVRSLVTMYFLIRVAGDHIQIHQKRSGDTSSFGDEFVVCVRTSEEPIGGYWKPSSLWNEEEVGKFIDSYAAYLIPDVAAEICSVRMFSSPLHKILDAILTNPNIVQKCDEVVNLIAENKPSQVSNMLSSTGKDINLCLILHLLDLLFKKCESTAIKLTVTFYPKIRPWNIQQCLFGCGAVAVDIIKDLASHHSGTKHRQFFLYLTELIKAQPSVCKNSEIVSTWICIGISDLFQPKEIVAFACDVVQRAAGLNIEGSMDNLWERLLELQCVQASVPLFRLRWPERDVSSMKFRNELKALWVLIVQMQDSEGAKHLVEFLSDHERDLPLIRMLLDDLSEGTTRAESDEPTKTGFDFTQQCIDIFIEALGNENGLQLLSDFPALSSRLNLSMCRLIVQRKRLENRRNEATCRLLEQMDAFTWSSSSGGERRRPPVRPVVLSTRAKAHLRLDGRGRGFAGAAPQRTSSVSSARETPPIPVAARSFEERGGSWGGVVPVHDDPQAGCPSCRLPVVGSTSDTGSGSANRNSNGSPAGSPENPPTAFSCKGVLLPCGHCYHASCYYDQQLCFRCLQEGTKTLCLISQGRGSMLG